MDSVFKATKRAADPARLTEIELRHVPVIEAPATIAAGEMFPVTVKIGRVPHVMDGEHYIQFIDLYAGPTYLARVSFTPISPMPKVTYFLVLGESAMLRAVAFCGRDGFWEAEQWLRVE